MFEECLMNGLLRHLGHLPNPSEEHCIENTQVFFN